MLLLQLSFTSPKLTKSQSTLLGRGVFPTFVLSRKQIKSQSPVFLGAVVGDFPTLIPESKTDKVSVQYFWRLEWYCCCARHQVSIWDGLKNVDIFLLPVVTVWITDSL